MPIKLPDYDNHFSAPVFELSHLDVLTNLLDSWGTAIDGGAHVGAWTQAMAKSFDVVHAFECEKRNFDCLVENTRDCANVLRHPHALGSAEGRGKLHAPVNPGNSGAGWVLECAEDEAEFDIVALDDYGYEVDFLKLDVEGFEPFALMGAQETIKLWHPVVMVEQKPITARYGVDYLEAGRILEGWGYKLAAKVNKDYFYK